MSIDSLIKSGARKTRSGLEKSVSKYTPLRSNWKANAIKGGVAAAIGVALNVFGGSVGDVASVVPWIYTASKAYQVYRDFNPNHRPPKGLVGRVQTYIKDNFENYRPRGERFTENSLKAAAGALVGGVLITRGIPAIGDLPVVFDLLGTLSCVYAFTKTYQASQDYTRRH